MNRSTLAIVVHHLRAKLVCHEPSEESDEQLLHAFTTHHDDAAFTVLVHRHGPMVLGVCRRVLGNVHDAEDAFQATFLVLARKAALLRRKSALVSWLHGVAYRIALKAHRSAERRRKHEGRAKAQTSVDPTDELLWREVQTLLDEEIARLPEKYRSVFVLCCLEDFSQAEAGRHLGLKLGTLANRLAEARKRLKQRLRCRGVEPMAVLAVTGLAGQAAAAVPAGLMASTIKAVCATTAGEGLAGVVSVSVAELVQSATAGMSASKTKMAILLLLVATLLASAGEWTWRTLATPQPAEQQAEAQTSTNPPATAKTKRPSRPAPASGEQRGTMSVAGQVYDPEGKPLAGAQITVLTGIQRFKRDGGLSRDQVVIGQGETDREGRFRLTLPRTNSVRNWVVNVVATHEGYGLDWKNLDADARSATVAIRLHPEQRLRGRLLDLQGQPVAGAKLRITRVHKGNASWLALDNSRHMGFVSPKPIVTDKNGHFLIRGIGGGATVGLLAEQESCSPERLKLTAGQEKPFVLVPARRLEGRVLFADTGKSAPHVEVIAWGVRGKTDENGHFRLNPVRGPILAQEEVGLILAYAPEGKPYLNAQKEFHWPKAAVTHRVDLALPRGVVVHGRVTEKDSGKAVAGALVFYEAQLSNPNAKLQEAGVFNYANGRNAVASRDDGTFQIACLPGAGYLTIEGPVPDYLLRENGGYNRFLFGKRGGQPWLSHGFAALDLQLGDKPPEIAVALSKGITLKADVSGPAGRPVGDLQVFCPLHGFATSPVRIRGGQVELHGCDAQQALRVMIFDAKHQWGATVEMSGKNASAKPIRLAPCGSARVRFLDAAGKPLVHFYPGLFLELTPKHGNLRADTDQVFSPVRKSGPHTDEQGWCTLTTLIPGARYHFGYEEIETTFLAKAGEVLKLPDVMMKNWPQ